MKPHRRKRLSIIVFISLGLSVSIGLVVYALSKNIDLFFTPTAVLAGEVVPGQQIRIGGMVKAGSLFKTDESLEVRFVATDCTSDLLVHYEGLLPDLFREGQGVVARGTVVDGVFMANQVCAKHDENYMSQEVRAAMEVSGGDEQCRQQLALMGEISGGKL